MRNACLAVLFVILPVIARADEMTIELKNGPGRDAVVNNCGACHSLDYIQMNSPFPDRKVWEAEVNKMIKSYGAPVGDDDAKAIIDYLTTNYGSGGPT